jgi:hypothetical protein
LWSAGLSFTTTLMALPLVGFATGVDLVLGVDGMNVHPSIR